MKPTPPSEQELLAERDALLVELIELRGVELQAVERVAELERDLERASEDKEEARAERDAFKSEIEHWKKMLDEANEDYAAVYDKYKRLMRAARDAWIGYRTGINVIGPMQALYRQLKAAE